MLFIEQKIETHGVYMAAKIYHSNPPCSVGFKTTGLYMMVFNVKEYILLGLAHVDL